MERAVAGACGGKPCCVGLGAHMAHPATDDELFCEMQTKPLDNKELNHVKSLREIQKNDINLTQFDSWKQLNNLMCDLVEGSMKYIIQPSQSTHRDENEDENE